jgi:hypothetical protein
MRKQQPVKIGWLAKFVITVLFWIPILASFVSVAGIPVGIILIIAWYYLIIKD